MKRKVLASMAAMALIACLLASPAAATSGPGSGAVQIIVTARAKVEYTVVDQDHIDLRANAPWRLTLEGPDGVTTVVGGKTGSTPRRLAVPMGTTAFAVALDN